MRPLSGIRVAITLVVAFVALTAGLLYLRRSATPLQEQQVVHLPFVQDQNPLATNPPATDPPAAAETPQPTPTEMVEPVPLESQLAASGEVVTATLEAAAPEAAAEAAPQAAPTPFVVAVTSTGSVSVESSVGGTLAPLSTSPSTMLYVSTTYCLIQDTHTVAEGENLFRIGLGYGLSWEFVARCNGLFDANQLTPGQVLFIPANEVTHMVASGQTLLAIGQLYGLAPEAIAAANGISDINTIQAGQLLIIPGQ